MTRMSERFVTSKFRAAETLLEDGRIPEGWMEAVERKVFRDWLGRPREEATSESSAREALLEMLDRLIKYFEKCPFFDNPETRELMLSRLREIAESWRAKEWAQIVQEGAPSPES